MTKSDLNLIHAFIDSKNLKKELNYAYFGADGIYATDTSIAIHFSAPMLGLDVLLHKKILKGFIGSIDSDASVSVDGFGFLKSDCGVKMSCNTYNYDNPKVPDFKIMFDVQFEYRMTLEDISDLHFELSQRECFIDDNRLYPIIEFGGCDKYEVFFNKQKITEDSTNTGFAKIVGIFSDEDEIDKVKFTALVMGREFKTQAQEQLLLNI